MYGCDQVVVHLRCDPIGKQRRLPGRRIVACPRAIQVELHAAAIEGGERVLVLLEVAVELVVCTPPQLSVGVDHELRPRRLAERLGPLRRVDGAEVEVHVGEGGERLACGLIGLDLQRQQPFLRLREHVRLEAQQLAQRDAELGQRRVGQELLHHGVGDRLELRSEVALFRLGAAGDVEVAREAALVVAVAGVLAGAQVGVVADPFVELLQLVEEFQAGPQVRGGLAEGALEGADARYQLLVLLQTLLPGVLGRI